jgi:hypothetical protein
MIFEKKKILVWVDDPPEDRVISIVAGCLANHDRAHSLRCPSKKKNQSRTSYFANVRRITFNLRRTLYFLTIDNEKEEH